MCCAGQSLRTKIYSSAPVKSLNGRNLDGSMLCSLAEAYAAALNSGSSLNIGDAWSQVHASDAGSRSCSPCHRLASVSPPSAAATDSLSGDVTAGASDCRSDSLECGAAGFAEPQLAGGGGRHSALR